MEENKEISHMSKETEELIIDFEVVELAQIDALIEQGIYSNRADFIREASRKHLEVHREKIEFQLFTIGRFVTNEKEGTKIIGISLITQKSLRKLAKNHQKIRLNVTGMLIIDTHVDPQLFEETVKHVALRGKLVASNEIKEIIEKMK